MSKNLAFWGGFVFAGLAYGGASLAGLSAEQAATAAVAAICAVFWIAQPVPIPVTSLIPFFVFPLTGVLAEKQVAHSYGHHLVLLLMAGFMLSMAIEACGAHRRLALLMTRLVSGSGPVQAPRLLLGFMIAAAFASMWISNTAATLILLPIALAASEGKEQAILRPRLLLAVAYAASIGGIGTPIGTPPNLLFMATYQELFGQSWSFVQWMRMGLPIVVLMLPLAFVFLARPLVGVTLPPLPTLGAPSVKERRVLLIFLATALSWVLRTGPFGGWTGWLGLGGVGDATVAFAGLFLMLTVSDGEGGRLLKWEEAREIPWGILLLFGGGIALAAGFGQSGLSSSIGEGLGSLAQAPTWLVILSVALLVTFLTEVTSNTATTALLMPILGAAAQAAGIAPELLMFPAAVSASCAFMLPVATAPNAIVFGSGQVSPVLMARTGLVLNLGGALVVFVVCWLLL